MKRLAVLAAVATLAFGADAPDHYKGMGWTKALWVQAMHAATDPRVFAANWAHNFNKTAAKQHSKLRVWAIACVNHKGGYMVCEAVFASSKYAYSCLAMAVDPVDGKTLQAARVTCSQAAVAAAGVVAAPKA